ncbi:LytR/AlgR family response regulator transcription factor [Pedobacter miscanthi]|uniref:DNA-binding response regulator n=1 Tax=Pedobacter miscanthi TaxID=2259170 RepID=A0A366L010_9SPHI|nr:LytTR family DNA-binding domain-containing protein [Pedobacter miscanthi]RBQ06644.1 DNA-binding response regulator [Pedobacter miscanthi]
MNCLIVDDQKIFRTVLKRMFELDSALVLAGECNDAIEAHQLVAEKQIDLIFLDIRMPGMSGLEFAKILEDKRPLIIFTTSIAEHAAEAFDLNVVDFLLKPISPSRFLKAVEKAKEIFSNQSIAVDGNMSDYVFIRHSNIISRLKLTDILFFEATGDYVKVHTTKQQYSIHSSLKTIEQKLPQNVFLRVHRSFIINLNKIDTAEGKTLVINHNLIPVSETYRADLNKRMTFL